ncbi:hypothetical protein [Thaumasiovibrio subtropicus]|uniref:hypothetical protein n=1 Tax=Thaumasiovibrio subtropicus TaxID=1891207 RepID=UPI000B35DC1F|nr:hypothetical protein [Thaumasiovibrio subtropicus]
MQQIDSYLIDDRNDELKVTVQPEQTIYSVAGRTLEAVFDVGSQGTLFLTTENCPFEETLYISLFDKDGHMRDSVTLFRAYTAGIVQSLQPLSDGSLLFTFWDKTELQLLVGSDTAPSTWKKLLAAEGIHYEKRFTTSALNILIRE